MKNLRTSVGAVATLTAAACYPAPVMMPDDPAFAGCTPDAFIEDAENGDSQILVQGGRGGYFYTYADENGSTVSPRGDFRMSEGGAGGTAYAIHISGKLAKGTEAFAGVGFSFTEPKGTYDASGYRGLSFVAKKAPGTSGFMRLKIPDASTDPDGGVCKDCFNDFGMDFEISEEWTRYTVEFSALKQEEGWGDPNPPGVDPTKLYGVQWQVTTAGADYDIWIDDVTFMGCQ